MSRNNFRINLSFSDLIRLAVGMRITTICNEDKSVHFITLGKKTRVIK